MKKTAPMKKGFRTLDDRFRKFIRKMSPAEESSMAVKHSQRSGVPAIRAGMSADRERKTVSTKAPGRPKQRKYLSK